MLKGKRFENKKICVAVSGGGDSVALLHYLKSGEKEGGYQLFALHCEHGIRGQESVEDMRFVQALCKEWEIPLQVAREDCPLRAARERVSLETAARNFRYEQFEALLKGGKADYIATAHHQGDEAETVLFRLARGSALTGASAMQAEREGYIRPFLDRPKQEILEYLRAHGLTFREDGTNFVLDATRNKIRLEVLPKLEEAVPGAGENLARFALLAGEDDALLYKLSASLLTKEGEEFLVLFSDEKPLFSRACLTAMKAAGLERDYTSTHLRALFALQKSERGSVVVLPQGVRAERAEKGIRFYREQEEDLLPAGQEKPFTLGGYDGGRYEVNISFALPKEESGFPILRADADKIPPSARFRFRREGDYIYRYGGGKKSLKKFFNEEKIPPKERAYLPLIAEENGETYAVCGVEISQKIAVDGRTKKTVYIQLRKKEKGK